MALGNPISIPVPNLDEVLESYNRIRLYKASSQAGSYSLLTTITLVAGTYHYSYQDTTGTSTEWYRYSFYDTVLANESPQSDPQPAGGTATYSRQTIRRLVAHMCNLYGYPRGSFTHPGPSGTTTAAGDANTIVAAGHINTRVPARYYTGHFMLMNAAPVEGEEREVDSFTNTSGTYEMATPFSTAPGSGNNFDLYGEAPSGIWNEAIDSARRKLWLPFRVPIAGVSSQTEYALPDFITREAQIESFRRQSGSTFNNYQYGITDRIDLIEHDGGGLSLYIPGQLSEGSIYYLAGKAHPTEFLSDASTLPLADDVLEYFLARVAQAFYERLSDGLTGASEDRSIYERRAVRWESKARGFVQALNLGPKPKAAIRGWTAAVGASTYDLDAR